MMNCNKLIPELIIFDCDGVLVDSEPLSIKAMEQVYANHGMELKAGLVAKGVGMKHADIAALIERESGFSLPAEAYADFWPITREYFSGQLQETLDIKDFLGALNLKRCVASSSTPERIKFSLKETGLSDYFGNDIFSSTMVKHGKPAPDLFLYAAEKMDVDPALCVVIEDSPYGVEGAVRAGMTALGYIGGSHSYPAHKDCLINAGASGIFKHWGELGSDISNYRTL